MNKNVYTVVRMATKKLRNFETKNPDVRNERYKELFRQKVEAEVSKHKFEVDAAKKQESMKLKNMSDNEFLDLSFKENAKINAKNNLLEKNRQEEKLKQQEFNKQFYDEVLQPAIAKNIIMSIVENSK